MNTIFKKGLIMPLFIICNALLISAEPTSQSADKVLRQLVSIKWGEENAILPSAKVLVQYEQDLGERWIVDFETGDVTLECLWSPDTSLSDPRVINTMINATSNLYVSIPVLPQLMLKEQQVEGYIPSLCENRETITYTVKKGDTLSELSLKMRVPVELIMEVNGLTDPNRIRIGQELIIPEAPPHMDSPGHKHQTAQESILCGQLTDPESGMLITAETIGEFGRKIIRRNGITGKIIHGGDGRSRKLSRVELKLAKNHLLVRARRYYPLVRKNAERFGHDPAVIMALIHTESAFNPQASSSANAYGLMQVVPSSGGREAYKWLHSKDIKPSPDYLLKPSQNLELGNAYIKILKDRTFAGVKNPESRLYCAVAAYNAGGVNVGQAFTGRKSVQASIATINAKSPEEVRQQLESNAPYKETRKYVKQVLDRVVLYRSPQWQR